MALTLDDTAEVLAATMPMAWSMVNPPLATAASRLSFSLCLLMDCWLLRRTWCLVVVDLEEVGVEGVGMEEEEGVEAWVGPVGVL